MMSSGIFQGFTTHVSCLQEDFDIFRSASLKLKPFKLQPEVKYLDHIVGRN